MIPDFLKLYPGMIEIISKIKSLGIPVGILTNRITPSLMDHLRFYKLVDLFDVFSFYRYIVFIYFCLKAYLYTYRM